MSLYFLVGHLSILDTEHLWESRCGFRSDSLKCSVSKVVGGCVRGCVCVGVGVCGCVWVCVCVWVGE